MSIENIRAALEVQLATVSPNLPTAFEGARFDPVAGVPYQRVTLLPAEVQNPTFGSAYRRETGIFQVLLCYPAQATPAYPRGSGGAAAQAELIRAAFPRGASFIAGGVTVQIDRTPSIAAGLISGDRYCIPVRVRYYANISG